MVSLTEICTLLHKLLQADLFEDACPNGLQVEGKPEVTKIATAVTASQSAIDQAAEWGASILFVHHGLFWNRENPCLIGAKKKKAAKLLEKGISLIAYHLPLDAHPEVGNNFRAGRDLGLESLVPFQKIGVLGRLTPTPIAEMEKRVEKYYGQKSRSLFYGPDSVKKVAIISGSGYRELLAAKRAGADLFITGSVDEPVYHVAQEEKIHFMGVGHAASEKVGPRAVGELLAKTFSLPHKFIDEDNPF